MGNVGARGGLSDFEYDHPEVLEGGPAISEGAESEAAALEGGRADRAAAGASEIGFGGFRAGNLVFLRDGGSVTFDGPLDRSETARLRFDGALRSPTRGEVLVKVQGSRGQTSAGRRLGAAERKSLIQALDRQIASPRAGEDTSGLKLLADRLKSRQAEMACVNETSNDFMVSFNLNGYMTRNFNVPNPMVPPTGDYPMKVMIGGREVGQMTLHWVKESR